MSSLSLIASFYLAEANLSTDSGVLLPEAMVTAIRTIARSPKVKPMSEALLAHIADLETKVRNFDFRLQYLFSQCKNTAGLLATARSQFMGKQKA